MKYYEKSKNCIFKKEKRKNIVKMDLKYYKYFLCLLFYFRDISGFFLNDMCVDCQKVLFKSS